MRTKYNICLTGSILCGILKWDWCSRECVNNVCDVLRCEVSYAGGMVSFRK